MAHAGCSPCFSHKAPTGRLIADEPSANNLQRDCTSQIDVESLVSHPHSTAPQFKRLSFCILENRVMLEPKLRRDVCNRIALGLDSPPQGANWAVSAVVRQQRTAHRA